MAQKGTPRPSREQMRRYRQQRSGWASANHTTALQTVAAWTPGHNHRTRLSSFPTAAVCCPIWPTPLGTADSTSAGPDRRKTLTSAAGQTPPTGADSHGQSCARIGTPGFSGC